MKTNIASIMFGAMLISSVHAGVAVIANPSVTLEGKNTVLADVFALETDKAKGVDLVLFDAQSGGTEKFYGWLGKSLPDFKKIWMKKQLAGEGKAPTKLGSEEDVLAKVASTKGAIGYVDEKKVTSEVKVLVVIP